MTSGKFHLLSREPTSRENQRFLSAMKAPRVEQPIFPVWRRWRIIDVFHDISGRLTTTGGGVRHAIGTPLVVSIPIGREREALRGGNHPPSNFLIGSRRSVKLYHRQRRRLAVQSIISDLF